MFFFFFQAEDGIRDLTVTGVQTCALPIYAEPDITLPTHARFARVQADPHFEVDACRDRKSTRLNSSHSQISYAVFCLKKKQRRQRTRPAVALAPTHLPS